MKAEFHRGNRERLYGRLEPGSVVVQFAGGAPRKTADEYYPFYADRSFVYATGVEQAGSALLAYVGEGEVRERLFTLPSDLLLERWNGARLTPAEASERSGVAEVRPLPELDGALDRLLAGEKPDRVYLDLDKLTRGEADNEAYRLAAYLGGRFPHIAIANLNPHLRALRTIKQPCEIDAMRRAQTVTREGILAMMRASRPGMYEYQYKAEFDYALAQRGVLSPAFPPIISAGANNFCIHYYAYTGRAEAGDMVLNDVGACWDGLANDVSRGWPVDGRFSERQRILYECALATTDYMFATLAPGLPMAEVDRTIRRFNWERLRDAGVCPSFEDIGTYMWHGGAHHVGYDTHDVVDASGPLAPGVVFCVDVGIYHEGWGIGFRLEDNCLITETGCENLSAATPRTIAEIEDAMVKR